MIRDYRNGGIGQSPEMNYIDERARDREPQTIAPEPIRTYRVFRSEEDARLYRHIKGTGGWIFACKDTATAILFPPEMAPVHILNHPLTRGKSGRLIGAQ